MVQKRIRHYEGRSRKFFMGNAFVWHPDGTFRSSVLIRTAVVPMKDFQVTSEFGEYAAGSGIVKNSQPIQEMLEIRTKCAVLQDPGDM
jgi:anthranilate/para-aminobenzoate synthase component I